MNYPVPLGRFIPASARIAPPPVAQVAPPGTAMQKQPHPKKPRKRRQRLCEPAVCSHLNGWHRNGKAKLPGDVRVRCNDCLTQRTVKAAVGYAICNGAADVPPRRKTGYQPGRKRPDVSEHNKTRKGEKRKTR